MLAHSIDEAVVRHATTLAQPVYLQSGDRRLFGWLDVRAAGPLSGLGLVICSPFGYEALSAHRSMRIFAESAAALGVAVLRFDYAGTGDSDDIDEDAEQIGIWTDDVVAATLELRRLTGVPRIGLLGLRLGALLAALAIERGAVAHGLMALAPVVNGRSYIKELRRTQLMTLQGAAPAAPSESLEFSGFSLSPRTLATLADLDLATRVPLPLPEIHILDRSDLPSAAAWAAMLSARGIAARYELSPGFVEMMQTPPYDAETPASVTARVCEFARAIGASAPLPTEISARVVSAEPTPLPCETALATPGAPFGKLESLKERAVYVSGDPGIFGIVTTPGPTEMRRRAVILLNDGATYHIGASRINVLLARRWAQRGYYVLRLDLAGLGDSATRTGAEDDDVFPAAALEDVRAGMEFMRGEYGCHEVTLAGLCSGAYHCLRAAAEGLPVDRVLMINPEHFSRQDGLHGDSRFAAEVVRNAGLYRERILSPKYWGRVVRGEVNLWRVLRVYFGRIALTIVGILRESARRLRIRLPGDVGWELEAIAARGVRIVFVFARGEPGIELLRIRAGASLKRLGDRCPVRIIDEADHVFSRSGPRRVLENILSEELFTRNDRGGFPGAVSSV